MRKPEITKKTRTPSSATSKKKTADGGTGKPEVPPRWPSRTKLIEMARRPSSDGIRFITR